MSALKRQCFESLRSRARLGNGIGSATYRSLGNGSVPEFQVCKYSTSRTRTTAKSSQTIRNTPSSKKGLSSHTLPRQTALTASHNATISSDEITTISPSSSTSTMPKPPPLSLLPISSLLRGIFTSTISSSPLLLPPSLRIMSLLAHSHSPILNPDRNTLLRWVLKHTFYAQFCAGENAAEVSRTVKRLKSWGCEGVMLCYAKEAELEESSGKTEDADAAEKEIRPWLESTMETVKITAPGDFVALKFTGAGPLVLQDLSHGRSPSTSMHSAITAICTLASTRSVRLLFDAEAALLQPGVDDWTLHYMSLFNQHHTPPTIYCTYQAYLKRCPTVLSTHLAAARSANFTIGVKLVRGAYLASDPRGLIHDTKADTDEAYDAIAESVMRRRYGAVLKPAAGEEGRAFPDVALVLAGHNLESARKAMGIRNEQVARGEELIPMEYAQLQGMADEVSCELVQVAREAESKGGMAVDPPKVYKYLVWGTTGECLKYLLRRAQENKDAVVRTREGRDLMVGEVWRRLVSRG